MFGFLSMKDNYDQRKVARYEKEALIVSTAMVTDSLKPYETAVKHPDYNHGAWVIVESYDDKTQAQKGHDQWVKTMTAKYLPKELKDKGQSKIGRVASMVGCETTFKKKSKSRTYYGGRKG